MTSIFQDEIIKLKREIRDLKTAQLLPSVLRKYHADGEIPAQSYSGVYTWTIQFEDVGDTETPLVYSDPGYNFLPYDPITNSQKIEWATTSSTCQEPGSIPIESSRPIISVTKDF